MLVLLLQIRDTLEDVRPCLPSRTVLVSYSNHRTIAMYRILAIKLSRTKSESSRFMS
jgi:hypothetical protein